MSQVEYLAMMESLRKSAARLASAPFEAKFELSIVMDLYTTLVEEYTNLLDRGLFA